MRTIALFMCRRPVAQGLARSLEGVPDTRLLYEGDYAKAGDIAAAGHADIALVEVAEAGEYDAGYCLALCARLRAAGCKLLLLCPEQDESAVAKAVDAKHNGLIEDFIFYDASIEYLSSKLLAT